MRSWNKRKTWIIWLLSAFAAAAFRLRNASQRRSDRSKNAKSRSESSISIFTATISQHDFASSRCLTRPEIPFSVQGKDIILMDDVLYTGRTIRAALDALFDHGRPARVQLLVLIDRGHRELPIEARYVGRTVQTTDDEIIEVKFQEIDDMEKVLLVELSARSRVNGR